MSGPRVALFMTCLTDTLYPNTGKALVRLLERLGCDVDFPLDQTCCGQMHFNTGYREHARPMAEAYASVFGGYDYVVAPSGSCAGMVREIHPGLCGTSPAVERTYELSEFLVDVLGVTDVGAYFPHRVTYHPTCHSLRMLGVGDKPLRLLRAVAGLDLRELPQAEQCCGFGGTFALKNAETSTAMLADKMRCVQDTGAEVVSAGDNSCLMHIGGGLSRLQAGVRAVHLAEILASTEEEPWAATP
ncbi:(Fe-S)-binding protein [Prauserella rugosa]|uniref:L-lactate dehydrogenase complex protein LldE n=1 Tax=Prauserella rugosa TaxID=43354 RepID=A0A660CHG2_9PSEU|nr:(Fe-S)-binding protein [Prauserella rugosa]KID29334.1 Cysteine-rich domain [Prauserella sp. Am3]KMS91987.1 Fe-S oxidoreductase [Streptomyces regensis]TWH21307.1 L-lactate dehydrogenase complex protein LldE [Prauserella rugosa]